METYSVTIIMIIVKVLRTREDSPVSDAGGDYDEVLIFQPPEKPPIRIR